MSGVGAEAGKEIGAEGRGCQVCAPRPEREIGVWGVVGSCGGGGSGEGVLSACTGIGEEDRSRGGCEVA